MNLDVLELGRTSFIGAFLLIGAGLLLHLFVGVRRPASIKSPSWFLALAFALGSYGVGVFLENLAERYVEEGGVIGLTSDNRVRAGVLFELDCKGPFRFRICSYEVEPLAESLDRHFCRYDSQMQGSYAADFIEPLHALVSNPPFGLWAMALWMASTNGLSPSLLRNGARRSTASSWPRHM